MLLVFSVYYMTVQFGVVTITRAHCGVQIVSSCGYLVSEYAFHITYLLPYSEKLRIKRHEIASIFNEVLQAVYGFVSSFWFWELK